MSTISLKTLAFAALLGCLALAAHTGQASAKSILSCKGSTRQSVIDCCEDLVRRKGMPYWMRQHDLSCGSAAICSGGKPNNGPGIAAAVVKKKCYITRIGKDSSDHTPTSKDGRKK